MHYNKYRHDLNMSIKNRTLSLLTLKSLNRFDWDLADLLIKRYLRRCRRRTVRHRIQQCKASGLFNESELDIRFKVFYGMQSHFLRKLNDLGDMPEELEKSYHKKSDEGMDGLKKKKNKNLKKRKTLNESSVVEAFYHRNRGKRNTLHIKKIKSSATPHLRSLSDAVLSPDHVLGFEDVPSVSIMIEARYLRDMNLYNTVNSFEELSLVNPLNFE